MSGCRFNRRVLGVREGSLKVEVAEELDVSTVERLVLLAELYGSHAGCRGNVFYVISVCVNCNAGLGDVK